MSGASDPTVSGAASDPEFANLAGRTPSGVPAPRQGESDLPHATAEQPPPAPPRLGGFRIVRLLGAGGMGSVYEAEDETLRRRVAVKLMRPDLAAWADARERFLREARAAAALHHDRVVPIYHVGEHEGTPFIVMPLLAGESLADRLRRGPRLGVAEVVRVGGEIAEGLAAAHAAGLVHRDVKPANVWLKEPAGAAVLLDFGLARAVEGGSDLTAPGSVLGTPAYMAPEQAEGRPADARADLFSLGVVLYEMAAAVQPFAGPTPLATLHQVLHHRPPPLNAVDPAAPRALSALIERLMTKDPAGRPGSAGEVIRELQPIGDQLRSAAANAPGPATLAGGTGARDRHGPRPWWRGRLALAIVLGAVATLALALPWLAPPSDQRKTVPPPPVVPPDEPLRVALLEVRHFARTGGSDAVDRGVLGSQSFGVRVGDQVTVEAKLSRPAYAYLIAFRADGVAELCFPEDDAEPPPRTDRPRYPSKSRDKRYGLDEGAGLWVFAAVASETPLPAYRDWVAGRTVPWSRPEPAPAGTVWIDDGQWVQTASARGVDRGDRAKGVVAPGRSAVVRLADWLKDAGPAAAVGFVAEAAN